MNKKFRVIFMGSPSEVISVLQGLENMHTNGLLELVCVISQPARPVGRKRKLQDPPVAIYAKERHILTLQPDKARDSAFLAELELLKPDIVVTAAYGQILSQEFLNIPTRATINVHPSLLPKYRGATPIPSALLHGDEQTGVTILFTVKALDAGSMILQTNHAIKPHETAAELTQDLFQLGAELLPDALGNLQSPTFDGIPQEESKISHCKKILKTDGLVNWSDKAHVIHNKFRAFQPWPGLYTYFGDRKITISKVQISSSKMATGNPPCGGFNWDNDLGALRVKTSDGYLDIFELVPEGSKLMNSKSFWNGIARNSTITSFHSDSS
jgi:methionyl-tRNA formyltransferase